MGSIGIPELIMIFVIALLLFGPRKLPEIGRSIGKAMGEFRRASNDLKRSLEEEVAAEELRGVGREVKSAAAAVTAPLTTLDTPEPSPAGTAEPAPATQEPETPATQGPGAPTTEPPSPTEPK